MALGRDDSRRTVCGLNLLRHLKLRINRSIREKKWVGDENK